mgnify:CR=1 FL=1
MSEEGLASKDPISCYSMVLNTVDRIPGKQALIDTDRFVLVLLSVSVYLCLSVCGHFMVHYTFLCLHSMVLNTMERIPVN